MRPMGVPAVAGQRLRAAAHRISVEWDDEAGETVTGVYVPIRHTDSRLGVALGGRWFPGVHDPARVEVSTSGHDLRWRSDPTEAGGLSIQVAVSAGTVPDVGPACDPVGATCLGATVGLSPGRRGRLEAARMEPSHRHARAVTVEELDSRFLDGFTTARVAAAYLMCDADVTWAREHAPLITRAGAAT